VRQLDEIRAQLASPSYGPYVDGRKDLKIRERAQTGATPPGSEADVAK
jgi:hypothetical protein